MTGLGTQIAPLSRVSIAGGTQPLWRGDGNELFYLAPDGSVMMVAARATPGRIEFDPAQKLFPAPLSLVIRRSYAASADGQRFLIPVLDESNPPVITVARAPQVR